MYKWNWHEGQLWKNSFHTSHQQLLLTKQRWGEELKIEVKPVINSTDITMVVLSWAIWPVPVSDTWHSPEENNKVNLSFKGLQSGLCHMRLSPSVDLGKREKEKRGKETSNSCWSRRSRYISSSLFLSLSHTLHHSVNRLSMWIWSAPQTFHRWIPVDRHKKLNYPQAQAYMLR